MRIARRRQRGFSLIEIMVVIVILGILAAAIIPNLISAPGEAKVARAKTDLSSLAAQLRTFYLHMDRYPTTSEGLDALMHQPDGDDTNRWRGPYLTKLTKDPWGRDYIYESPGSVNDTAFDLYSFGSDGQEGGEGVNADIKEWDPEAATTGK